MFASRYFSFKDRPSGNGKDLSLPKFSTSPNQGSHSRTGSPRVGRARSGAGERAPTGPQRRCGSAAAAQERWAAIPRESPQPGAWAVLVPGSPSSEALAFCKTSRPFPSGADSKQKPPISGSARVCWWRLMTCGHPTSSTPLSLVTGTDWSKRGGSGTQKQGSLLFCSSFASSSLSGQTGLVQPLCPASSVCSPAAAHGRVFVPAAVVGVCDDRASTYQSMVSCVDSFRAQRARNERNSIPWPCLGVTSLEKLVKH